jgi:hypothetical protein
MLLEDRDEYFRLFDNVQLCNEQNYEEMVRLWSLYKTAKISLVAPEKYNPHMLETYGNFCIQFKDILRPLFVNEQMLKFSIPQLKAIDGLLACIAKEIKPILREDAHNFLEPLKSQAEEFFNQIKTDYAVYVKMCINLKKHQDELKKLESVAIVVVNTVTQLMIPQANTPLTAALPSLPAFQLQPGKIAWQVLKFSALAGGGTALITATVGLSAPAVVATAVSAGIAGGVAGGSFEITSQLNGYFSSLANNNAGSPLAFQMAVQQQWKDYPLAMQLYCLSSTLVITGRTLVNYGQALRDADYLRFAEPSLSALKNKYGWSNALGDLIGGTIDRVLGTGQYESGFLDITRGNNEFFTKNPNLIFAVLNESRNHLSYGIPNYLDGLKNLYEESEKWKNDKIYCQARITDIGNQNRRLANAINTTIRQINNNPQQQYCLLM